MPTTYQGRGNDRVKLGKVANPRVCVQFRKKNLVRLSKWYWVRLDANPDWDFFQLYRKVVDLLHVQFSGEDSAFSEWNMERSSFV